MSKPAVLIIEDSASLALGFAAQLEEAGYDVAPVRPAMDMFAARAKA